MYLDCLAYLLPPAISNALISLIGFSVLLWNPRLGIGSRTALVLRFVLSPLNVLVNVVSFLLTRTDVCSDLAKGYVYPVGILVILFYGMLFGFFLGMMQRKHPTLTARDFVLTTSMMAALGAVLCFMPYSQELMVLQRLTAG